jgi:hypothetical protein
MMAKALKMMRIEVSLASFRGCEQLQADIPWDVQKPAGDAR